MGEIPGCGMSGRRGVIRRLRPVSRPGARRLREDEDGSVTLETVMWFPVMLSILSVIADLSMIYTVNADMWHVSYDTARRMSREELSAADAPAHVRNALPAYVADKVKVSATRDGDHAELSLEASSGAVGLIGVFDMISDAPLVARVRLPIQGGDKPDFSQFYNMGTGAGAPAGGA